MRRLFAILLMLSTSGALAQEPVLRTELQSDIAVPGQPIELWVTVLAPTWFPKPPELPSYDMPNLMVRLPPKSTFPVSEQIDGETWSGVYRIYRLYPMIPGVFEIPPQTVRVHYAQPGSSDPVTVELQTDAMALSGTVPPNAMDLDPFVAARALDIDQAIEGEVADVAPGDAITRSLRISVDGAPPMIIPPLLDPQRVPGMAVYASEPVLEETLDDGTLSGSRMEKVTYVAEAGGRFFVPAVRLDWYNLETGQIESAQAEGFEITVAGPAPAASESELPLNDLLLRLLATIGIALLIIAVWLRMRPGLNMWREKRKVRYLTSESYAFRLALRAIDDQRLGLALGATRLWWHRHTRNSLTMPAKLSATFLSIGQSLYGSASAGKRPTEQSWNEAERTLRKHNRYANKTTRSSLPSLNPSTAGQPIKFH